MSNGVPPEGFPIATSLPPISNRLPNTVLKNQSLGDLAYYNLASIPEAAKMEKHDFFDNTYMTALYKFAYYLGRRGCPWQKSPPGVPT